MKSLFCEILIVEFLAFYDRCLEDSRWNYAIFLPHTKNHRRHIKLRKNNG